MVKRRPRGKKLEKKAAGWNRLVFFPAKRKSESFTVRLLEEREKGFFYRRAKSDGSVPTRPPAAPRRGRELREHGTRSHRQWSGQGSGGSKKTSAKQEKHQIARLTDLVTSRSLCLSFAFFFDGFDAAKRRQSISE